MKDVFSRVPDFTPYTAIIPGSLCAAPVDPNLVPACASGSAALQSPPVPDLHDRAWWARRTSRFDFSREDRIDADAFNRVLAEGIRGNRPRGGRHTRARSLAAAR